MTPMHKKTWQRLTLSAQAKLLFVLGLTAAFCVAEIVVGFHTHSLALIADSFHYLFDFGSYLIAYTANKLSDRPTAPSRLTFGYARARILGSFINGISLAALGFSVFIQSLQRFVMNEPVEQPILMLIMGCIGLLLNAVSLTFFHDHHEPEHLVASVSSLEGKDLEDSLPITPTLSHDGDQSLVRQCDPEQKRHHDHDHGFRALFLHVIADTAANLGVIIAAIIIWQTSSPARFYADPALSLTISILIAGISIPLIRKNGMLLMESTSTTTKVEDVLAALSNVSGITSVYDLKLWRLDELDTMALVHAVVEPEVSAMQVKRDIRDCLRSKGITRTTIELQSK